MHDTHKNENYHKELQEKDFSAASDWEGSATSAFHGEF